MVSLFLSWSICTLFGSCIATFWRMPRWCGVDGIRLTSYCVFRKRKTGAAATCWMPSVQVREKTVASRLVHRVGIRQNTMEYPVIITVNFQLTRDKWHDTNCLRVHIFGIIASRNGSEIIWLNYYLQLDTISLLNATLNTKPSLNHHWFIYWCNKIDYRREEQCFTERLGA